MSFKCLFLGSRRAVHPAPSTQHLEPSTQHPAPSTQHPAPGTQGAAVQNTSQNTTFGAILKKGHDVVRCDLLADAFHEDCQHAPIPAPPLHRVAVVDRDFRSARARIVARVSIEPANLSAGYPDAKTPAPPSAAAHWSGAAWLPGVAARCMRGIRDHPTSTHLIPTDVFERVFGVLAGASAA